MVYSLFTCARNWTDKGVYTILIFFLPRSGFVQLQDKIVVRFALTIYPYSFDLSALEYLSSSGVRVFLNTTRDLKQKNGRMVLCALNIFVKEIFEERDFAIADSVSTGLKALS